MQAVLTEGLKNRKKNHARTQVTKWKTLLYSLEACYRETHFLNSAISLMEQMRIMSVLFYSSGKTAEKALKNRKLMMEFLKQRCENILSLIKEASDNITPCFY